jgi:hypothetical protein
MTKPICPNPEDCCRELSRVWEALGIDSYTGKSASEHVRRLSTALEDIASADETSTLEGAVAIAVAALGVDTEGRDEGQQQQLPCKGCGSKGFSPSVLGPDRCTFCDGTEAGLCPHCGEPRHPGRQCMQSICGCGRPYFRCDTITDECESCYELRREVGL